jgi:Family of unknown function (DUF6174)
MTNEKKKRIPRFVWWLSGLVLFLIVVEVLFDPFSLAVNGIVRLRIRYELKQARAAWEAAGIENYDFVIYGYTPLSCILMEEKITVRGGRAPERPDTPSWQYCQVPLTVPEGFDRVEEALKRGDSIQASFDEQYGYVHSFNYSCMSSRGLLSPIVSDCSGGFHIPSFAPRDDS